MLPNIVSSAILASFANVVPASLSLIVPEPSVADNSIVESSTVTSTSSALTVIPSPPITFTVASPEVAQPVIPAPATTDVISPVANVRVPCI
jgi:hypothetical protein